MIMEKFPKHIFSGYFGKIHCQGIAVDEEKGYVYFSFTTKLIKTDLEGNLIGTVDGLIGHLGCIAFNKEDGKVYGSLELKTTLSEKEFSLLSVWTEGLTTPSTAPSSTLTI